ncbi:MULTISPECIES: TetR/AcrR family transcriptional regulator [Enterococcus]|uniref:TetR/AcrR family transcriptional regulator n=1 Tax=Enterococcus TaxID=1350 RepID=UPI000ED5803A|nr:MULTISPECIES: TetR/AcrR family transcriptional regulator [Enterococcus]HCM87474.1 TetR/AcrR family transcriptional regulator [Enterococcus sp.]
MSNKTDRTKMHIIQTFFEMMNDIGFEKITVANLSQRAKINRGTFYHHFPDKYAVLEEVEDEIYSNFEQVLNDHVGWAVTEKIDVYGREQVEKFFNEACLFVMKFLYERKETAQTLLGEHGRPQFIEKLERAYIFAVQKKIRLNSHEFTEVERLQQEFIYFGAIAIVKRWIRNGAKESPEEMAQVISKCMTTPPIEIFETIERGGSTTR